MYIEDDLEKVISLALFDAYSWSEIVTVSLDSKS